MAVRLRPRTREARRLLTLDWDRKETCQYQENIDILFHVLLSNMENNARGLIASSISQNSDFAIYLKQIFLDTLAMFLQIVSTLIC